MKPKINVFVKMFITGEFQQIPSAAVTRLGGSWEAGTQSRLAIWVAEIKTVEPSIIYCLLEHAYVGAYNQGWSLDLIHGTARVYLGA